MTMNIVELKPVPDAYGLSKALRNIADDIEAGDYSFDPSIAVLVLATETSRTDREGISVNYNWQTHGLGEKCGFFVARGILASALSKFESGGE